MNREKTHKPFPILSDRQTPPDDVVLRRHLGRSMHAWSELTRIAQAHSMTLEWNYYADGGSWLCKLVHNRKTVCWLSVWPKSFRATFYFLERHHAGIAALSIDPALEKSFRSAAPAGKLKPLTVSIRSKKQLKDAVSLIEYKAYRCR